MMENEVSYDEFIKELKSEYQKWRRMMADIPFIPFKDSDFSPGIAQKHLQISRLLIEVYDELKRMNLPKSGSKKFRYIGSHGRYGRYFWLYNIGARLCYDAYLWETLKETPLWLRLYGIKDWDNDEKVRIALSSLEQADPPKFIVHHDNYLIPLYVLKDVDKEAVIENIIVQIDEVASLIKDF